MGIKLGMQHLLGKLGLFGRLQGKRPREREGSVWIRSKHGKMERRGKDGQPRVSRQLVGTFSGWAVPDDCGLSCLLVKLF